MTKAVFLDTNILVDLVMTRQPFNQEAEKIFELRHTSEYELYISALSIANISYIANRAGQNSTELIKKLMYWTVVIDLKKSMIDQALTSKFNDFEDALQYFSATSIAKMDFIITRNKKHFKDSLLPVVTPSEFLKSLQ